MNERSVRGGDGAVEVCYLCGEACLRASAIV
jgi:hypothetical protein